MKGLTKSQLNGKADHVASITKAKEALDAAIESYNRAMADARSAVEMALNELTEAIDAADQWRSEIHDDMETFSADKSERWKEGEKGQAWMNWMEEWDNELPPIDFELPDELDLPDCDVADIIDNLPDEPDAM